MTVKIYRGAVKDGDIVDYLASMPRDPELKKHIAQQFGKGFYTICSYTRKAGKSFPVRKTLVVDDMFLNRENIQSGDSEVISRGNIDSHLKLSTEILFALREINEKLDILMQGEDEILSDEEEKPKEGGVDSLFERMLSRIMEKGGI